MGKAIMLFISFFIVSTLNISSNVDAFTSMNKANRFVNSVHHQYGRIVSANDSSLGIDVRVMSGTELFYRAHEGGDSDDSISQLRTRAAPTFQKSEVERSLEKSLRGINTQLIVSLVINQCIILFLAGGLTALYVFISGDRQFVTDGIFNWNDIMSSNGSQLDLSITPTRFVQGLLGSMPTIALSRKIEHSDDRKFALTNFSTTFMVMTLFGRRRSRIQEKDKKVSIDKLDPITKTLDVAFVAAGLSYLTGFCEEIVFRGLLPHVLKSTICQGSSALACIGQASLFALGHSSPKTSMQENKTVMSIQFLNGMWEGVLYLLVGGDIVPCIIAHALYDFQILFFTWISVNDQLEYSYIKSLEPIPKDSLVELTEMKRQLGTKLPEATFEMCKRVFYIFDEDKNGFISRSEVQRGISYLGAEGFIVAPSQKTVDSVFDSCIKMREKKGVDVQTKTTDQLRFVDFVRLFLTVKAVSTSVIAR